jgi:hypothetical protein
MLYPTRLASLVDPGVSGACSCLLALNVTLSYPHAGHKSRGIIVGDGSVGAVPPT